MQITRELPEERPTHTVNLSELRGGWMLIRSSFDDWPELPDPNKEPSFPVGDVARSSEPHAAQVEAATSTRRESALANITHDSSAVLTLGELIRELEDSMRPGEH